MQASSPPDSDLQDSDRRRYRRVPLRLGVTYRSPTLTVDAQTSNLSLGGAFVISSRFDPIGTEADVILTVPEADALQLRGRVAWTTALETTASGASASGMGLVFQALGRDPRLMLANLLLSSSA